METVLLSIGLESLLVSFCIYNSYGSWTELRDLLGVIGASCLFVCALLHFTASPSAPSTPKQPVPSSPLYHHECFTNHQPATTVSTNNAPSDHHQDALAAIGPVHSLNTTLSSMSPLPSLGLSPTRSPSTTQPAESRVIGPRVIRSPTASVSPSKMKAKSMDKPVMLTSTKQELHPLLHHPRVAVPGSTSTTRGTCGVSHKVMKRTDYLDWTDYFLSVAMLSAMRSKDPSTQVGACIVNEEKRIVGIGYNGFPRGCSDDELPWNRKSERGENDTKYPYVCHAEMNAIMNKNSSSCNDCTMYVVLFPCNDCAKLIIQAGIKRVIYICDKYAKTNSVIASKRLFNMAGVQFTQYVPQTKSVLINFPLPNQ